MREYKSTYCTTLLYSWAMIFLSCFPLLILADVAAATEGSAALGQIFLGAVLVLCLFGAASALFVPVISFLIGLFAHKSVMLSDQSISYEGKTIQLDSIRYITLHLPEVSKHQSKSQVLMIWADKKNYMYIKRPSIALIAALKKRCVFASFDVDDWKSHLRQCLWIQLGIFVFGLVAVIFGFD